ncbi:MAG TPA: hypothetical protein VJ549_03830 [Geothrix sp.]|nr:hypothetical protein [Geothrix sp.]
MPALTASDLLLAWEQGQGVTHPERALLLLDAAGLGPSGTLPVGQRDSLLLALRERLFGRAMICVVPCPHCAEKLEFPLDTRQFGSTPDAPDDLRLERGGYRLRFRLPLGCDLVACAAEPDLESAERRLLQACILEARLHQDPIPPEQLPEALLQGLASTMAEADPCADLQVQADCPLCGHRWQSTFDIVSFLWTELQDWAIRILQEVHALATAYGWPEREILELSPWRRRLYLQLVGP